MKNKLGLIITIVVLLIIVILSIPRKYELTDGGTVKYKATIWEYTNYNSMLGGTNYLVGKKFKLFGITLYDNTKEEQRVY